MKAYDFSYDGINLSDKGFILCNFGDKGLDTVSNGSVITFNTISSLGGYKHNLTSTQYEDCLGTTMQICKNPCCGNNMEISSTELRELTRWLNRKEFKKFKILDEEHIDLYYESSFNISRIEMDGRLYGLELEVVTNSPFAFKEPRTITIKNTTKDGKHSIVASKSSNRNVMQFNPNNGSPIFACYASASQTAVVLYPYSMVKEDTTPRIAVTDDTTKDVVFGGETVTFNYELKYLDGEALSWEVSDEEMISEVTAEDGVLSVTVAENDGEARTATITLSCGDAEEVVLTINQAEYVDTSVIEKITVAEFLEKSVDANVWYELTGTVSGISNTTYGNFNLVDATGTVYVYGLTATKVASNDSIVIPKVIDRVIINDFDFILDS